MDTNGTSENLREASAEQLSDDQMDLVAGGIVDATSPTLYQLCYQGKHIQSGKLH
jgi:type VI protein secretion system component Hcp